MSDRYAFVRAERETYGKMAAQMVMVAWECVRAKRSGNERVAQWARDIEAHLYAGMENDIECKVGEFYDDPAGTERHIEWLVNTHIASGSPAPWALLDIAAYSRYLDE